MKKIESKIPPLILESPSYWIYKKYSDSEIT